MKLKELVPPLNLCKLIPKGEFEDSALMWIEVEIPQENKKEWRVVNATKPILVCDNPKYPAPTLEEILAKLPPYAENEHILACCVPDWADFNARIFGEHWRVGYTGDASINDKSPSTAALKLWLKLKGIEYENSNNQHKA